MNYLITVFLKFRDSAYPRRAALFHSLGPESGGASGLVEYAVAVQHGKDVVICGHSNRGAVGEASTSGVAAPAAGSSLSFTAAVACLVLIALALRSSMVSMGPLLPAIRTAFGLSYTTASLLIAIPNLLMGLLALPTPWLARRFGRDDVILVALALVLVATVARALAPTAGLLMLATVGVGCGIAVAGTLVAGFIKASHPRRAPMLMGIYGSSLSFGSTLSASLTAPMSAATGGWRIAAGAWSLTCLVAIAAWIYVWRHDGDPRRAAAPALRPHRSPLANRTAWLIALFFACDNFLFFAFLSWIVPLYREHGDSAVASGYVLGSFTTGFLVANPIMGALSRNEDRRPWLVVCALVTLAGAVMTAMNPFWAPFVTIPLMAFGIGGAFSLGMTLPLDNAGSAAEANQWNALTMAVGYGIASAGPLLVGGLRDLTGGFGTALWLLVGVAVLMLAATPFLRPHHHRPAGRGVRAKERFT